MAPLHAFGRKWHHLTPETVMLDAFYLALGAGAFALCAIAVRSLQRL